jgi:hypothetical protein
MDEPITFCTHGTIGDQNIHGNPILFMEKRKVHTPIQHPTVGAFGYC